MGYKLIRERKRPPPKVFEADGTNCDAATYMILEIFGRIVSTLYFYVKKIGVNYYSTFTFLFHLQKFSL